MTIGTMRHRIEFQRPTPSSRDAYGQPTEPWSTFATVWARVDQLDGRELTQARQRQSTATHRVETRYYPDIRTTDRIRFGTRILNVESVTDPDGRNVTLTIMAIEQTAGAK